MPSFLAKSITSEGEIFDKLTSVIRERVIEAEDEFLIRGGLIRKVFSFFSFFLMGFFCGVGYEIFKSWREGRA